MDTFAQVARDAAALTEMQEQVIAALKKDLARMTAERDSLQQREIQELRMIKAAKALIAGAIKWHERRARFFYMKVEESSEEAAFMWRDLAKAEENRAAILKG